MMNSPLVVFIQAGVLAHLNCCEREELGVEGRRRKVKRWGK